MCELDRHYDINSEKSRIESFDRSLRRWEEIKEKLKICDFLLHISLRRIKWELGGNLRHEVRI